MDGMSSKAKVYFFISAMVLIVAFHATKSFGVFGNIFFIFLGVVSLIVIKAIFELVSKQWKRAQSKMVDIQKVWSILLKLSQMETKQINQVFTGPSPEPPTEAKIFHLRPKLGLVQFEEMNTPITRVHKVPYQSRQTILDLQQIEDAASKLPKEEKKLVIFVSQQAQFFEPELLDALTGLHVPESAIQRNIFHKTDVIEVSMEGFAQHRSLFDRIEQILGLQYSHYIILYPQEPGNVVQFKLQKNPAQDDNHTP